MWQSREVLTALDDFAARAAVDAKHAAQIADHADVAVMPTSSANRWT